MDEAIPNPQSGDPAAETAAPIPRRRRLIRLIDAKHTYQLPISSVILAGMALFFLQCMCGYMDSTGLPFTATAFAMAVYGWVVSRKPLPGRLVHMAAVVITAMVLTKDIADTFWSGHSPVF